MMSNEDILLDDDPIEFKGGTLALSTEDDSTETSLLNPKPITTSSAVALPWTNGDPKSFFCHRDELVSKAIEDVTETFCENDSDDIQGVWLLTEISFWDNERERMVAITKSHLIVIKYDFIALKILNHQKVSLCDVDTLTVGDLVYPSGSLAPHIHGITSGVMHVLKSCTFKFVRNNFLNFNNEANDIFDVTYFRARSRNVTGVRAMWNKGEPLKFSIKWNPFTNDIPWATFTSHPLLWHKSMEDDNIGVYDVDNFVTRLVRAVQQTPRTTLCHVQHQSILLQNYFGLLSIIHNRNNLGFFKIRGKFSF